MAQLGLIQEEQGVSGLGLALRKLPGIGSVLYITAHPDDENNALLARLSRGEGHRVGLLTLTRGDGGQNEIGSELFEALGVVRSGELMAVHRFDGVEQFFTRAFEFGYSFSVEETFQKWGRKEILGDIVRVIRTFRPLVIITMNPTGTGGGQHHQASALLAAEAFRLAGDPNQYPEQIEEGLLPWRTFRLFQSRGFGARANSSGDIRINLGEFDPILGETYAEFGARSRSLHRSQGMNVLPQPGEVFASFILANSTVDSWKLEDSFFGQVDVSLQGLTQFEPRLEASVSLLEGYIDWASESYEKGDYEAVAKAVMAGLDYVRKMIDSAENPEAIFLLERKELDFLNAAEKAHFLFLDALAQASGDGVVVAGEEFGVEVLFDVRSGRQVKVEAVELLADPDWEVNFERSRGISTIFRVKVSDNPTISAPFWFRGDPAVDRFSTLEGFRGIEPFQPPPVRARVRYSSFGVDAAIERAVHYRWFDAAYGKERRRELKVVPRVSVSIEPPLAIIKLSRPNPAIFEVTARNLSPDATAVNLKLDVPQGWRVEPKTIDVNLATSNRAETRRFSVRPPARIVEGAVSLRAVASSAEGEVFDTGFAAISYPHIATRHFYQPAASDLSVMDVDLPGGLKVGYVMGVGDFVGFATEQLGATVTYLTEEDLSSGELDQYDVIILGVRAYLVRNDLIENNANLMEYVRRGGHMVVQYNKYEFLREQFAPYPVHINRPHDRITVEDSPVKVLQADHQLFTRPNQIRESDWSNWVQERGLYFLGDWDSRFVPLLELQDPWPYNNAPKRGALLFTEYGEGTYVYTGLAFFRQLPAGVPGAYRLWANLISLGKLRSRR
jgi:LmbE family N-acetylglucosaminyl deacetylase